jgi:hypothetical protein
MDKEVNSMQFAVIMRATDRSTLSPQMQVALPKRTFEMLTSKPDPRIKAFYPFAGERAGLFIIDAGTADDLQETVGNLPLSPVASAEVHPIGTVQGTLKTLEQAERRLAEMAPVGATARS